MGRGELAKRIDVLAATITYDGAVEDLADLDLGYAPQYNTPQDPVHHAANTIRNKIEGLAESIGPAELKAKLESDEDYLVIDVREQREWDTWRIESPHIISIPQTVLLSRLDEIPRDKEIIISCRGGGRAYQSARMLKGAGFDNVRFAEGSLVAWPYEYFGGEKD